MNGILVCNHGLSQIGQSFIFVLFPFWITTSCAQFTPETGFRGIYEVLGMEPRSAMFQPSKCVPGTAL